MRKAVTIFAMFAGSLWAAAQTFTADTTYTIHRNGNISAYMYQNGTSIGTGSLSASNMCWWKLIPTQTDCYYIQNASTGEYVQSSYATELSQNVPMGSSPVEFQIKTDDTAGATTNGFYYMASTDQTITTVGDVSKGLNFGASGVVSYWIKSGRANSYWQIEESENQYVVPEPEPEDSTAEDPAVVAERTAQALGIYQTPCGTAGTYYLRLLTLQGLNTLSLSSNTKSTSAHVIYTTDRVQVRQGGTLIMTPRIAWYSASSVSGYAYTDWDADTHFEDTIPLVQNQTDTLQIPMDATLGEHRFRIRITTTNTEGAEDDVIGVCYDFFVDVVPAETPDYSVTLEVNDSTRGTAEYEIQNGVVTLKATPKEYCTFVGWKRMVNDFQGVSLGAEPETSFQVDGNMRIQALFSLMNDKERTAVQNIQPSTPKTSASYDLQGRRASNRTRGIVISNGKKHINK